MTNRLIALTAEAARLQREYDRAWDAQNWEALERITCQQYSCDLAIEEIEEENARRAHARGKWHAWVEA